MKYIFIKNGTMEIIDEIDANSREDAKELFFKKDNKNKQRFKNIRLINEYQYEKELKLIEKSKDLKDNFYRRINYEN